LKWSVLDQSPASAGSTQAAALRASLDLAQQCERLGFNRFWVSEHHNSASIVGTAPEILMAAIAVTTVRIRVGSAGVMLPHYSALKVAEQFRVLEALAPGRIDLGVGRAPGSDYLTAQALNPHANAADEFPRQVQELRHWVEGTALPSGHPFRAIRALPEGPTSPELWILGSSDYGAQLAAYLGLPYAFAYFFRDGAGAEQALALYRKHYQPTERHPTARPTICVWALAADSDAEALRSLSAREHWRVGFEKGLREALISPEDAAAAARRYSPAERELVARQREVAIAGTADKVAAQLRRLAARFDLDEIFINTWTFDPAARVNSYELLARELGL